MAVIGGQNRWFNHKVLSHSGTIQNTGMEHNFTILGHTSLLQPGLPSHDGYAHTLSPFTVTTTIRLHDNDAGQTIVLSGLGVVSIITTEKPQVQDYSR